MIGIVAPIAMTAGYVALVTYYIRTRSHAAAAALATALYALLAAALHLVSHNPDGAIPWVLIYGAWLTVLIRRAA